MVIIEKVILSFIYYVNEWSKELGVRYITNLINRAHYPAPSFRNGAQNTNIIKSSSVEGYYNFFVYKYILNATAYQHSVTAPE